MKKHLRRLKFWGKQSTPEPTETNNPLLNEMQKKGFPMAILGRDDDGRVVAVMVPLNAFGTPDELRQRVKEFTQIMLQNDENNRCTCPECLKRAFHCAIAEERYEDAQLIQMEFNEKYPEQNINE